MDVEEGNSKSDMLSSKRRYEILNKLRVLIESKNINIPNLFRSTGLKKNDQLDVNTFGKLILLIDNYINEL